MGVFGRSVAATAVASEAGAIAQRPVSSTQGGMMSRRVSLLALLALIVPAALLAYPGVGGGRGLVRVQNALVEDKAGLQISLHAIGRNPYFPGTSNKAYVIDLIAPEL